MGIDTPKLALPGDPELDFDFDGLTITAVARDGTHFSVELKGGFGFWVNDDGTRFIVEPGDESGAKLDRTTYHFGFAESAPESLLNKIEQRLVEWRDTAVPLHLTGAPGKLNVLMEDEQRWLPMPAGAR